MLQSVDTLSLHQALTRRELVYEQIDKEISLQEKEIEKSQEFKRII